MNRYENGQIYKIVDVGYNKCYIGSTCESLSKRMQRHRSDYKNYLINKHHWLSSFYLFHEFGVENCKIQWIEDYPCKSKKELERREGQHQQQNDCVNKQVAGRSIEEWRQENQEHIKQLNQKRYSKNNEELKEKSKDYYNANKSHILKDRAQRISCGCGSVCRKGNHLRHQKSEKHQAWLKQQKPEEEEEVEPVEQLK